MSSLGIIIKFIFATDASMFAGRYHGSSSSAITYANMIMTVIILLTYTIFQKRTQNIYRILLTLALVLTLTFIWSQTLTRGSLIGLILCFVLIILWNKRFRLIMFLGSSLLLFFIYLSPVGERLDNFLINLNNINFSTLENSTIENRSLNQRFAYSIFAIENIIKNPIMGIGASNVEQVMTTDFRNKRGILVAVADHVHNEYLDIALKFGTISLVIFLFIWITILYDFIKCKKNDLSYALVLTIISHMSYMLTQSIFAHHQASVFFIILLYILLPNLYSINKKT
ncbi:MAG: O-antigen ligase family protein [Pseudomonadota bacterium]|nr:O-antigen ligase family protein [Pseudomonadota bacterium]